MEHDQCTFESNRMVFLGQKNSISRILEQSMIDKSFRYVRTNLEIERIDLAKVLTHGTRKGLKGTKARNRVDGKCLRAAL